ncbi:hypothetical protein [Celeribacter sp.]|uniref:hypothetical protein n=1 Tax=Celeribacter sp. TaxID=1890673 RepID=UPI003A94087A
MTSRLVLIASVTALLAGVSIAAPHGTATQAPEVVEIHVPAADLDRCIATLDEVFIAPVDGDAVQSVSLNNVGAPVVKCVVDGVAS